MPLSVDSSLAVRPDLGTGAGSAEPAPASAVEQQRFSEALSRVQRPATAAGPTLVHATRTRLTGEEAAAALRGAWTAVRGEPPRPETLSILVGQWAHETGRGASMLNYNFGGLKGTGPTGLSAAYATREGWGENAARGVARFRAYGSAQEGAVDYVSLLARRYPDAVRAAERGDAPGFVRALKAGGYFTDDEAAYGKSVQSLAALASRAGFQALGAGAGGRAGGAASELAPAAVTPASLAAPSPELTAGMLPLLASTLRDVPAALTDEPLARLPVAPAAFADEVNRAALLMSALRIAEGSKDRGA